MSREVARGIALTLSVLAALPLLDFVHAIAAYATTVMGLVPPVAASTFVAVRIAMEAVLLVAKLAVLVWFIRAPQRFAWLVQSWIGPIALVAFAVVRYPVVTVLSFREALAVRVAMDRLVARREVPVGARVYEWTMAQQQVAHVASIGNAVLWAAVLLFAYARFRRATTGPAPST